MDKEREEEEEGETLEAGCSIPKACIRIVGGVLLGGGRRQSMRRVKKETQGQLKY
jgi:uncharacterized protein with ACT and thioredoxin-like domain